MINKKYKQCEYHQKDLQSICTFEDCNYQTRLVCTKCISPNEKFYHKHYDVENCIDFIKALYYKIDELITLTKYYHFKNINQKYINSFEELHYYLSCFRDYKLSRVIQENYQNLLLLKGPRLQQIYFNTYQINQFIIYQQSNLENINYNVLRIWRKYHLRMALLSDDNNLLIMGWNQYLSIHSLKDFNNYYYLKFEIPFTHCQFTPILKNLLIGFQNGLIKQYNFPRKVLLNKSLIIRCLSAVRNIEFVSNSIVLINVIQFKNKMSRVLKFQISNNKLIFNLVKQGDYYLLFDQYNKMIILNNKENIYIYQEYDRKLIIKFSLHNQFMSQIQQIDKNKLISLSTQGRLLIFRINYKQQYIEQIKSIDLNAYMIFFNKITQQIIAQTKESLIIINPQKFQQINLPFLMNNKRIKYDAERSIRPMQNSKNLLVTLSKNCVVLFEKK